MAPENMGRRNLRLDVLAVAASIAFGRLGCFARESSLADLLVIESKCLMIEYRLVKTNTETLFRCVRSFSSSTCFADSDR